MPRLSKKFGAPGDPLIHRQLMVSLPDRVVHGALGLR